MKIESSNVGIYKLIRIQDPLTLVSDLTELQFLIEGYLKNGIRSIAVSFTNASYLYSGAISVLITCYRLIKDENGHLCIIEPKKELLNLLHQMNIDSIIDIYPSIEILSTQSVAMEQDMINDLCHS